MICKWAHLGILGIRQSVIFLGDVSARLSRTRNRCRSYPFPLNMLEIIAIPGGLARHLLQTEYLRLAMVLISTHTVKSLLNLCSHVPVEI